MITIPVADAGMIDKTFSATHDSREPHSVMSEGRHE
jgi:hypothetical protein